MNRFRRRAAWYMPTLLLLVAPPADAKPAVSIAWTGWTPDLFAHAQTDQRLVLLDLEAVWCHWCHVMDEKTYSNAKVRSLIAAHYLAVRVDQDARPDLSNRYESYGWPATVIFDSEGHELAKRRGFIEPTEMTALLAKLARHPVPEPSDEEDAVQPASSPLLPPALVSELQSTQRESYDEKLGGWGSTHKLLFGEPEELAMGDADPQQQEHARRALHEALSLIDPVWGGAYQYSVRTWHEPHFEKIAEIQARNLFLYSLAYARWGEQDDLKAAQAVSRYIAEFLTSTEGALFTSQDADLVRGTHSAGYFALDDAGRRRRGIPVVDRHIYARENGWMAGALAFFGSLTGDTDAIERAARAVRWVQAHRAAEGGGFHHGESDPAGTLYLDDTLEMGIAFLRLYEATAERTWLEAARRPATFIEAHFRSPSGGFSTSQSALAAGLEPRPERGENIRLVRFANVLFHETGDDQFRVLAETAMRFVAAPAVARRGPPAGVLLAALELGRSPLHITIVGAKSDPVAKQLFDAARAAPTGYRRIEWWDRSEGPMPNADVAYPELKQPAAFVCTEKSCSLPIRDPVRLQDRLHPR
jgi:uncharacterized protein YyaL (SSP411 family)